MKKKLISLLVALTMIAVLLGGCGGGGSNADPEVTADPNRKVKLVVWESVDGPDEWIRQAGAAFNKIHPNITVEFVNVELNDTSTRIALDGPGGVGPDLFVAPHDKLGELVTAGHIYPTENPDTVGAKVLASTRDALTYDGKMYGYPTSAETYALYYNKALISSEDVPKTWADLLNWVRDFNVANSGKRGYVVDIANIYYAIPFTTKNGNRLFGPAGTDTTNSFLSTPDAIAGMKEFQALREILNFPASDMTTDQADGAFAAGTAAMHISGPWNVSNFTEAGIDFGITTLPALAGDSTPAASFSGTRGMFVSAYSDNQVEASLFGEFLISKEMQELRYEITGALPSIELTLSDPHTMGFIDQLNYAFPMPSLQQMGAFWASGNATMANIWDGADVETEMTTLNNIILGLANP